MTSMTMTRPDSFLALLGTVLLVLLVDVPQAHAASASEIDHEVDHALEEFRKFDSADAFLGIAKGALVFPKVHMAGIGLGGEYGEGALRVDSKSVDCDSTAAASVGFQLGAVDTTTIKDPVIGVVFGQKGLMFNLTLGGAKFSKLDKQ